jgi:hypothetical protein
MRWLALAAVLVAAVGFVTAIAVGQGSQAGGEFWLHCRNIPVVCNEEQTPTTTVTVTTTVTATTPPPIPGLGGSLPVRLPQSSGFVVTVNSVSELNAALGSVASGSTIRLHAGSYAGVNLSRSASSTAPITLEPYPGESVKFVASSSQQYPLKITGAYLRVRGIEITDPAGSSSTNVYMLGHDVELDRVDIHGNGTVQATYPTSGVSGIFSSSGSARLQVYNSKIHDVGVSENADHGWYMEGTGHVLANSLVYGETKGYGIQVYPQASNCLITNNTVVDNPYKAGIIVGGTDVHDNLFVNNIVAFSNPTDWAIRGYSNGVNNVVRDSLLWSPDTIRTGLGGIVVGPNVRSGDPQFANRAAHDYHAGANAAGGDPAYMPPTDIEGNPRERLAVGAYR